MRKFLKPLLYGCITFTGFAGHPQNLASVSNPVKNDAAILLAITNNLPAGKPLAKVNSKVAHLFIKYYKNAENVKWYYNGNGYLAIFDWDGVKTHACYGKDGYWYYDLRFGTEKDLPAAERRLIKSNYVAYTIGRATEVNLGNNQQAWIVNVEDADNLVLVRIIDRHLEELAHYDTHYPSHGSKK
jgi:hypothetical protein